MLVELTALEQRLKAVLEVVDGAALRIPPMPEMMPLEKAPPKKKSTNISTLAANNTQTSAMAKGECGIRRKRKSCLRWWEPPLAWRSCWPS